MARTKKETKVTMSESSIKRLFLAAYELVRTAANAIMEFVDNAIDAGATDFVVKFIGNRMLIINNGNPFSPGKLEEFLNSYSVNDLMDDGTLRRKLESKRIGHFGCGATDAMITLANYVKGCTVTVRSWGSPSTMEVGSIKIDERDIDAFLRKHEVTPLSESDPMVDFLCKGKKIGGVTGVEFEKGVCFEFENPRFSLGGRVKPDWLEDTIFRTSMIYSRNGINLNLCDNKVEKYDPVFLNKLNEEELTDGGFYKKDKVFFYIKNYKLHFIEDSDNKDDSNVKVVYAFTYELNGEKTQKSKGRLEDRNEATQYGGIYSSYSSRILTLGTDDKLYKTQRGGYGRFRVNVFTDGNEDLLKLKSVKSNGIDYTNANNQELSMCEILNPTQKGKRGQYVTFEDELKAVRGSFGGFYKRAMEIVKSGNDVSLDDFKRHILGKPTTIVAPNTQSKEEEAELTAMAEAATENEFSTTIVTVKNGGDGLVYEFTENSGYMVNREMATALLDVLRVNNVRPNKMAKIANDFLPKVSEKV